MRPEYVKKSNIAAISPRSRFRGMAVLSLCKNNYFAQVRRGKLHNFLGRSDACTGFR